MSRDVVIYRNRLEELILILGLLYTFELIDLCNINCLLIIFVLRKEC